MSYSILTIGAQLTQAIATKENIDKTAEKLESSINQVTATSDLLIQAHAKIKTELEVMKFNIDND